MTVSERGGPQRQAVELVLDPSAPSTWHPDDQPRVREAIKRRVRVAASLAIGLHGRHVPLRVSIGQRTQPIPCGATGRERLLDLFTDVPADGTAPEHAASEAITTPQRRIRPDALTVLVEGDGNDELSGDVTVRIIHGAAGSGKAAGAVGSANAAGAVASAQTALLVGGEPCRKRRLKRSVRDPYARSASPPSSGSRGTAVAAGRCFWPLCRYWVSCNSEPPPKNWQSSSAKGSRRWY
jgi:hypothetical protein